MNKELGAGLTLRTAEQEWYPARRLHQPAPSIGVEAGDSVVTFSDPRSTSSTITLALSDIQAVVRYLQSDEFYLKPPAVKSIAVERTFTDSNSPCTACRGDSAPAHNSTYSFTQHSPKRSIWRCAILHEPCVPQFIDALETVWDFSDAALSEEL